MHPRALLFALSVAFVAGLAAAQGDFNYGRMKIVNTYYIDQPSINITIAMNGNTANTFWNIPYKGATEWFYLSFSTHTIEISVGGNIMATREFTVNSASTVAVFAVGKGPDVFLISDSIDPIEAGKSRVSVGNYGGSFISGVDVGTSESTFSLAQNYYFSSTEFTVPVSINASTTTISLREAGTEGTPLASLTATLESRKHYLVTVTGVNGGTPAPELVMYELTDYSTRARLAFVHGMPGDSTVNVTADEGSMTLFHNIKYKGITDYKNIPVDVHIITIEYNGNTMTVTAFFNGFTESTLYALAGDGFYGKLLADNDAAPASNNGRLRVMHGATPSYFSVLADGTPIVEKVTSTLSSDYLSLTADFYLVSIKDDSGANIYNMTLTVVAGAVYTVVAVGDPTVTDSQAFTLIVVTDAMYGDNGNLRAVHAINNGGPNVDVKIGDTTLFSNVEFTTVSSYMSIEPGLYRVVIAAAGADLFTSPVRVDAGGYFTAVAGSVVEGIFQLRDDNTRPASTTARLRVVHASNGLPELNIEFGGSVVGSLLYTEVFGYTPVPEDSYVARVLSKIGNTQLFNASLTLEADTVVSAFAIAVEETLTIVPAIDFDFRTPAVAPTAPVASTPTAANTPTKTPTRASSASIVTVSVSLMALVALL